MTDRWQDSLESVELRESPVLDRYKTPDDAYQGLIESRATLGRSMLLPGENATPEEMLAVDAKLKEKIPGLFRMPNEADEEDTKRFWGDMGVPNDVDGYEPPADMEVLPDDLMANLREVALDAGMTQKQYAKFITKAATQNAAGVEAMTAAREEHTAELKQHWGAAYEENISITDTLISKFEDENVKLGDVNNAGRIMLMNVAKAVSGDPQVFNQINNPAPKRTPAEIRLDLAELRGSDIFKNRRKYTPTQYKAAVKKLETMHEELEQFGVE